MKKPEPAGQQELGRHGQEAALLLQRALPLLILGVLLPALLLRLRDLPVRSLEYDEIWTLEHYVRAASARAVLTDVATPNNHTLHSLAVRWTTQAFGVSFLTLRLPACLAGLGLLVTVTALAWVLFADRWLALLALALCAFHGGVVYYSQCARGYSLQLLLIAGFALIQILLEQRRLAESVAAPALALIALAAVVLLPTSLFYLVPLALCHGFWLWQQQPRRSLAALRRLCRRRAGTVAGYAVALLLVTAWLLWMMPQLQAAQAAFGVRITGAVPWLRFCARTMIRLCPWPLLVLAAAAVIRPGSRALAAAAALGVFFPLAASAVVGSGPTRVYLPVLLFVWPAALAGVAGIAERLSPWLSRRFAAVAMSVSVMAVLGVRAPAAVAAWTPPDWPAIYDAVEAMCGSDTVVAYPAGASLVIAFHRAPRAWQQHGERAWQGDARLVQVGFGNALSAVKPTSGAEVTLPFSEPDATASFPDVLGVPLGVYALRPLGGVVPAGEPATYLCVLRATSPSVRVELRAAIGLGRPGADWLLMNPFLQAAGGRDTPSRDRNVQLFCARAPELSEMAMARLQKRYPAAVVFRRIESRARVAVPGAGSRQTSHQSAAPVRAPDPEPFGKT